MTGWLDRCYLYGMNTNTAPAAPVIVYIPAEDAPIGVQIWPTLSAEYAPNFTLASVSIVRNYWGTHVLWTYENGNTRTFPLGIEVACSLPA